jgi:hypothetical protein
VKIQFGGVIEPLTDDERLTVAFPPPPYVKGAPVQLNARSGPGPLLRQWGGIVSGQQPFREVQPLLRLGEVLPDAVHLALQGEDPGAQLGTFGAPAALAL